MKQYYKFVKNITITYPILIPAKEIIVRPPEVVTKTLKQKEKSRDINSNRDLKTFTPKTQAISATRATTTSPKLRTTGKFNKLIGMLIFLRIF